MTTTVITGASSGIGAELARQLAARGEDLGLCARRVDRLEALREEITAAHPGRRVEVRAVDVTDEEGVRDAVTGFRETFGSLERVVVNAGLGKGAPIGTGRAAANRETAQTNVLGALATCEAAMEVFRDQRRGQLVVVSSMSAMRGLPGPVTVYAATKAFVAHLAEGIRMELLDKPDLDIRVTTVYPGYIRSEMNDRIPKPLPHMVDTRTGVAAIIAAIEGDRDEARVPAWPWRPLGTAMRHLPLRVVRRLV
ncbi:MAG TPA: SDR family oxidoreductase [Dermatophilaceae bacterium]|nr:SDR family oxidoreductase [Dermatophilaceae bacterium]